MSDIQNEIAIKVKGIKKHFIVGGREIPILHGVDFEIKKGEFVLLVGPSGCGKSTLLHIIYGLEAPTEGTVDIGGEDEWSHTKNWRANFRNDNIGFIPQQPFWIKSLTVIENIAIPAVIAGKTFHEGIQIAAKLIELVGMSEWSNHRPYDLSGGQQQRVALARSLLLDPKFVIADEPTGNLDPNTSVGIMKLLDRINREGTTVVMATHDAGIVDQMRKRVIELEGGHVIRDQVRGVYGYTG